MLVRALVKLHWTSVAWGTPSVLHVNVRVVNSLTVPAPPGVLDVVIAMGLSGGDGGVTRVLLGVMGCY